MAKVRPRERSVEEKTAIVLALVRGEATAAELCRRHGMSETTLYKWRDHFLAAGQQALANSKGKKSAVSALEQENQALKEALADAVLRNELLKKTRLL